MPTDTDVILAEVPKNASEVLRITQTTYEGHELIDVRCWTKPATPTGGDLLVETLSKHHTGPGVQCDADDDDRAVLPAARP